MKGFDINLIVRDNVKGLKPYSSARDEYVANGTEMVFLDANENPFDNGVNRYPDPQQRNLKSVLALRLGIGIDQLLLGNGSDEVLDLLFRAFCEPKTDNVITLPPTYGMYQVLAGINNIENREVVLSRDFQPDVDQILKTIDNHTKLIFICSPNNPTANSFDAVKIEALLNNFKGLVVIDEAYIDFAPNESWILRLADFPNLVVAQTLSKAYGLAGIRLGICAASPEIIKVLNKIKPPYNVNELTQQRALDRIAKTELVKAEVAELLQQRTLLESVLRQLRFVEHVYPSDSNFILVKVDDAEKRYQQLLQKGIVVRNRSSQPLCSNSLRFTVGTPEENIKLKAVLKSIDNE
ncbi:MAG: histidinol-phosphate transaminase [Flavobacteriaceae bacterium]